MYENGTYLLNNPTWHEEDSAWKAQHVARLLKQNNILPASVCEVGCGAGGVLQGLAEEFGDGVSFVGYDISPQAIALCRPKATARLSFHEKDLFEQATGTYDVTMAIDVFEHVEDYYGFLRKMRRTGRYKVFHIPLDLSVQSVLRSAPILHQRSLVGHLHYFTKETALATLQDTGYEVLDHVYTSSSLDLPNRGWKANLMKLPRKALSTLNKDLAARVLGGFSLLVLAR